MVNKKDILIKNDDYWKERMRVEIEQDKMKSKFEVKRHEMKMKELEFIRESDRVHHERELERGRIKSAEIRKTQMRKFEGNPYHS